MKGIGLLWTEENRLMAVGVLHEGWRVGFNISALWVTGAAKDGDDVPQHAHKVVYAGPSPRAAWRALQAFRASPPAPITPCPCGPAGAAP